MGGPRPPHTLAVLREWGPGREEIGILSPRRVFPPFCPVRKGPPEGVSPHLRLPSGGYVRLQIFDLVSRTMPCAEAVGAADG